MNLKYEQLDIIFYLTASSELQHGNAKQYEFAANAGLEL